MENWYWKANSHTNTATLAESVESKYGVVYGDRLYHLYDQGWAGANYATSLHKIGGKALAIQDFDWDLSEDIKVIGDNSLGYLDALNTVWWNDVLANSDLLLNSPVTRIDTSGSDVIVTTENGDLHAARQVILTVSIGVLQSEMIDFTPDLPASMVREMDPISRSANLKR